MAGAYRAYSEPEFIEALRASARVEVIRTSSDEWPEDGGCPKRVVVRVRMALDAGKAVLIEKDGAYRYYLVDKTAETALRRP